MIMNTTTKKLSTFKKSQDKSTQIIDKIVANKKYHKKELLQPIIDSMDELIELAEKKINQ